MSGLKIEGILIDGRESKDGRNARDHCTLYF